VAGEKLALAEPYATAPVLDQQPHLEAAKEVAGGEGVARAGLAEREPDDIPLALGLDQEVLPQPGGVAYPIKPVGTSDAPEPERPDAGGGVRGGCPLRYMAPPWRLTIR
jgi:hypothetical protein